MRTTFPVWVASSVLVCGLIATGCSQSPTAPSSSTTAAPTSTETDAVTQSAQATHAAGLTPEDLEARGWDCRTPPLNPNLLSCSRPNQLHSLLLPGPPPPADRPASITLLIFENGVFLGTSVLIRSDLYRGQPCRSTGGAYNNLARIGYFECLHRPAAG